MEAPTLSGSVEKKRQEYRPPNICFLFIGESAPANGTFFYFGDSNLARYTREAFEEVFGPFSETTTFLAAFRDWGCYLIDLCSEPVNQLPKSTRREARKAEIPRLAAALSGLQPIVVIVVMKAIRKPVTQALQEAGLGEVEMHALPFPAQGHQQKYAAQLAELIRRFQSGSFPFKVAK